jgi:hypothetical protein
VENPIRIEKINKIDKNQYFSLFIRGIKISCSGIGSKKPIINP